MELLVMVGVVIGIGGIILALSAIKDVNDLIGDIDRSRELNSKLYDSTEKRFEVMVKSKNQ